FNVGGGSTFTGGVSVDGATVNVSGVVGLTMSGTNAFTSGDITGAGPVTINGTFNWSAGIFDGTGSTTIAAAAMVNAANGGSGHQIIDTRTFTNNGTIVLTPHVSGYTLIIGNCNPTTLTNNGTLTYNGLASGDPGIIGCNGTIDNNATLQRLGGSGGAAITTV